MSETNVTRRSFLSGAAFDRFVDASKNLYMAPESYAEIPADAQANYMFPYMYPVPRVPPPGTRSTGRLFVSTSRRLRHFRASGCGVS